MLNFSLHFFRWISQYWHLHTLKNNLRKLGRCVKTIFASVLLFVFFQFTHFSILSLKNASSTVDLGKFRSFWPAVILFFPFLFFFVCFFFSTETRYHIYLSFSLWRVFFLLFFILSDLSLCCLTFDVHWTAHFKLVGLLRRKLKFHDFNKSKMYLFCDAFKLLHLPCW